MLLPAKMDRKSNSPRKRSVMEDKNGNELKILSTRFKEKKERTMKGKSKGSSNSKEEQLKAENQKKKEELEEVTT